MKELFFLTMEVSPSRFCKSFKQSAVISEHPLTLLVRNEESNESIVILFYRRIPLREYIMFKKYNPTREGYIKLKEEDYETTL